MTHRRTSSTAAASTASLLLAAILASSPRAQTPDGGDHAATDRDVSVLKAAYLRCDRAATERMLDMGEAADCSTIYEALLRLGFEGDFERLLAWWRAERVARALGG